MKFSYNQKKLSEICKNSYSYSQCLKKMGLRASGGNYATLKNRIKEYNIDISHFTLQGWNKGMIIGPKRPIEDYLSNKRYITSWKLKRRLLKEKIFSHRCQGCGLTSWLEQPIPLELHHIDGSHSNNNIKNLSLLCPNCHALTDNYRSKNRR